MAMAYVPLHERLDVTAGAVAYDRVRGTERGKAMSKAHAMVRRAVRDGVLVKPKACVDCGKMRPLDGHHDDYSRPLDVKWLCKPCHRLTHTRGSL